mmetsp:Transcript_33356/g.94498  ORF Transcript_33356/g.94498 Transcript_33356/m.94498 type:complete len:214 (-) Transcript_33356:948-1589(-)
MRASPACLSRQLQDSHAAARAALLEDMPTRVGSLLRSSVGKPLLPGACRSVAMSFGGCSSLGSSGSKFASASGSVIHSAPAALGVFSLGGRSVPLCGASAASGCRAARGDSTRLTVTSSLVVKLWAEGSGLRNRKSTALRSCLVVGCEAEGDSVDGAPLWALGWELSSGRRSPGIGCRVPGGVAPKSADGDAWAMNCELPACHCCGASMLPCE